MVIFFLNSKCKRKEYNILLWQFHLVKYAESTVDGKLTGQLVEGGPNGSERREFIDNITTFPSSNNFPRSEKFLYFLLRGARHARTTHEGLLGPFIFRGSHPQEHILQRERNPKFGV